MNQEIIGLCAGIFTAASLVPQLVKSLKDKKVEVSPLMFCLLTAGNGLWVWYGIMLEDLPIIATNAFAVTMDIVMLFLKYWYSRK